MDIQTKSLKTFKLNKLQTQNNRTKHYKPSTKNFHEPGVRCQKSKPRV